MMLLNRPPNARTLQSIIYTDTGTFPDGGMSSAAYAAVPSVAAGGRTVTDATATNTNTVQTSASAVAASAGSIALFGTNIVRFGSNEDAFRHGWCCEGSSTNLFADCRQSAYSAITSGTYTPNQTDPAGGTGAGRFQVDADNRSGFDQFSYGASGTKACQWMMLKQGSGGATWQMFTGLTPAAQNAAIGGSAPAAYTPESRSGTADGASDFHFPVDGNNRTTLGGIASGARDEIWAWIQAEPRPGPTQLIYTTGATRSKSPVIGSISDFAAWVDGSGRLNWDFSWTPFWDQALYMLLGEDVVLLWKDANTNVVLQVPSGYLVATINGIPAVLGTPLFSSRDRLRINVRAGGTTRLTYGSISIAPSGSDVFGAAKFMGQNNAPQAAWPSGGYKVGGNGTTTSLFAFVNYEQAYADAA